VDRLLLYWTAEEEKEKALMAFSYRPERIDEAGRYFDEVVGHIQTEQFRVIQPPEAAICKECDLRSLCEADGILMPAGARP
jgi:CRISPR/Cas system-associated exonuclease Cas4 (RecB family)